MIGETPQSKTIVVYMCWEYGLLSECQAIIRTVAYLESGHCNGGTTIYLSVYRHTACQMVIELTPDLSLRLLYHCL